LIIGEPDETFHKVYHTVLEAQKRAIDAIKEGANAKDVDGVARSYINEQGFEGKFGHSLGHGTGLAVHEGPRMGPIKDKTLLSGMIVTVEPGIYLPHWGGVRIENQVVVEKNGPRVLNRLNTTFAIEQII
jgi:Xaa-Pro aminopeptidase